MKLILLFFYEYIKIKKLNLKVVRMPPSQIFNICYVSNFNLFSSRVVFLSHLIQGTHTRYSFTLIHQTNVNNNCKWLQIDSENMNKLAIWFRIGKASMKWTCNSVQSTSK